MAETNETMSEAEAMHELAKQMWERYFKQRAIDELLNHSLDGYKATVSRNNGDGTLTVVRPFDNNSMTLRCPPALASQARMGDQVLVVSLGEMSNSFILCGTDMQGLGDWGEKVRLLDFSNIEELETFLIETENDVTETYTVTRDSHGRIVTIEDEDGFDTYVQWPEFTLTPADKIGYDNTDSGAQATNVQEALDELFAGGGGGGGPELSDDDPLMDGDTPSPGTSVKASRADHRHQTDNSRASAAALTSHVQNTGNPHNVTAAQAGAMPSTATLDDIPNGTTYAKPTAAQVAQIGTNETDIDTIEGKIPSAASTTNQLADKAFVTDAITQGTAIFRGSFASKAALLAVAWQTTDPNAANYVSNNDYAVVLDDETQNDECWRYIYVTGTGWTPQYRINESPLTQAQLDALNSGATAAIISSVADKLDKTGDGKDVTATFTAASTRANISTGEKLSVLFGKIAKWFSDLGTAAWRAATGSITSGSTALVESGAVYTGLAGKVDSKWYSGENLIDNWYFVGGGTGPGVFPINQRHITGNSSGYAFDRWRPSTGTNFSWSLVAEGLKFVNNGSTAYACPQDLSDASMLLGKRVCYSILTTTGLYKNTGVLPSTFNNSGGQISVSDGTNVIGQLYVSSSTIQVRLRSAANSGTITFVAAKLELGTEQTLAHQENGVWVLNEIPDYEEELIKCQTSTADPSDTYANKTLSVNVTNRNLLDNWYFMQSQVRGGQLPINRRGLTTLSTLQAYFIDRWATFDGAGSVSISSSGLSITGGTSWFRFGQQIPLWKIEGFQITISVLIDSITSGGTFGLGLGESSGYIVNNYGMSGIGQIAATSAGLYSVTGIPVHNSSGNINDLANCLFRITQGATAVIKAVKLEYGSQQTLAHQENGAWVLNEIPDYNEELIKCETNQGTTDTYANKAIATEQQIAYVETGTTTSRAYSVGEYFCWNGLLYLVTTAISRGGTIVPGTNCVAPPAGGINDLANVITYINGNSSITLNVPYFAAGLIATARSTTGHASLAFVTAAAVVPLVTSASITYSLSNSVLTISNSTANPINLYIFNFSNAIRITVN